MWASGGDDMSFGKSRFDQQGGGGGFLNTTANTPNAGEKKKSDRLTNILPITIAQIHLMNDGDENLKVGNTTAKIVKIVGVVQSVDVQTTRVTYVVDDHTGPGIEVQMWFGDNDDQNKKINIVQENTYACVIGAVRSMKGKRHVIGFSVTTLKDINEITLHIAEVMHCTKSLLVADKQNLNFSKSMQSDDTFASAVDNNSFGMNMAPNSDMGRLSRPQQLVKQAIINCTDDEGISARDLHNILKSLNRQSIQEALDFLSNEGHIYTTVDDEHYKSTDCV